MNSRERLLAAINHELPDHIPLMSRCFGFQPAPCWTWQRNGTQIEYWYTGRMESLHTIREPWNLPEDDFRRVEAWFALGVDDIIDVSVPWSMDPRVSVRDYRESVTKPERHVCSCREYTTPDGILTHRVRLTGERVERGWVVQPEYPPLFEDYNIPRAVRHAMLSEEDLSKLRHLLRAPNKDQLEAFRRRMSLIRRFAEEKQVMVAAWTLFGMDGVVWLCGVEHAVLMAMTQPALFEQVVRLIDEFDVMRTELMLEIGGVDLIVQRGWYSSTDFWSPGLFQRYVLPSLRKNVALVHQADKKFAYVMTTGVRSLLSFLAEAGVDLWYWADPEMGDVDNATIRRELGGKVAVAGGVDAARTLKSGSPEAIRTRIVDAIETLGPDGLIVEAMDSLFPDTPWPSVETMITVWRELVG